MPHQQHFTAQRTAQQTASSPLSPGQKAEMKEDYTELIKGVKEDVFKNVKE